MKPERSRGVNRAARCARPRSVTYMLARRPVLGACALALAGTLYGASTAPLAWVLRSGVDAEAFLSLRFAFAAVVLLLFCRRPVADPVALLKAGVGCGLALAGSMDATGWLPTAALGIGVSGGAYLLQAIGQSVVPPATAGLLLHDPAAECGPGRLDGR